MKKFRMRNIRAITLSALIVLQMPYSAAASGFPVIDISNLTQNLLTAAQTLQQLENQIRQMQTYTSSSYYGVNSALGNNYNDLGTLLGQVRGISYNLGNIQRQYEQVFPNQTQWDNIDPTQYGQYYKGWNSELSNSASTAMQAQGVITRIQGNNVRAQEILAQTDGADGEVRQLQAQNQMLGLMSSQLNDVNTTLATSARVTATAAAVSAGTKQNERSTAEMLRKNYTDLGTPPMQLNRLP